jgi:ATP-dependent Clp protease ATP-binding subunit ClpC
MTSNVGAEKLQKEAKLGFEATDKADMENLDALHAANKSKVHDELKKLMRPELINRIDKIVVFRALTKKDALAILDVQLDELRGRLVKHGLILEVQSKAKVWLVEKGYDSHYGVRPLRRLIQDEIEDVIASSLLEGDYAKGDVVHVSVKKNMLNFTVSHETK